MKNITEKLETKKKNLLQMKNQYYQQITSLQNQINQYNKQLQEMGNKYNVVVAQLALIDELGENNTNGKGTDT